MCLSRVHSLRSYLHRRLDSHEHERERTTLSRPALQIPRHHSPVDPHAWHHSDQLSSPLFALLPLHLRRRIYALVLSGAPLHLAFQTSILSCTRCTHEDLATGWLHPCWGPYASSGYDGRCTRTPADRALLNLPLTCRRVASEALPMLYAQNEFHVRQPLALTRLVARTPAAWVEMVGVLEIDTRFGFSRGGFGRCADHNLPLCDVGPWQDAWRAIARDMRGLRVLRVRISCEGGWGGLVRDQMLVLEPLCLVRVRVFEVEVRFDVSEKVWEALGEVPFVLMGGAQEEDESQGEVKEWPLQSVMEAQEEVVVPKVVRHTVVIRRKPRHRAQASSGSWYEE